MRHIDAFYLPMGQGQRFCLMHTPSAGIHGALLFIHPFAEEMNKCRRMAAVQARSFADAGWTVLQLDLLGCGDSSGDFGDATWQRWVQDILEASAWLQRETGVVPGFWGLRAGCLLATQAARALEAIPNLVLWQPMLSGRQVLHQFLRLKLGSQIVGHTSCEPTATQNMREQLAHGEAVEVIGYSIAPAMAAGMEAASLEPPVKQTRVAWLEVGGAQKLELSPASQIRVQQWRDGGHIVDARVVHGPAFWQTPEITECPALIESTLAAVHACPR